MQEETRVYPLDHYIRCYRNGRIESNRSGKWLPLKIDHENKYPTVRIKTNGKSRKIAVHKIVAWSWHGPPEPGQICRHLNDDKQDYGAHNLKWGTHKENAQDAIRNGRCGQKNRPLTLGERESRSQPPGPCNTSDTDVECQSDFPAYIVDASGAVRYLPLPPPPKKRQRGGFWRVREELRKLGFAHI